MLIVGNLFSFIRYLIIAMFFNIYANLGAKNLVEAYNTAMELGYIKPIMQKTRSINVNLVFFLSVF